MGIAREDSKRARRRIHIDAHYRETGGCDVGFTKANVNLASLIAALQLEVSQAAIEHDFRLAIRALTAQRGEGKAAIRGDAGYAAVLKLHFSLAVLAGGDPVSLK